MYRFRIGIFLALIALLTSCGNDSSTVEEVEMPQTEIISPDMDSEDPTEESDADDSTEESFMADNADDDGIVYLKPCTTYQDILDNIYEVIVSDRNADFVVPDALFSTVGIRESIGRIGYTFYDVDSNGIEELIIADTSDEGGGPWDNRILLMYTLHDDQLVLLIDGWARNRYYLLKDHTIYNEASGGAADTTYSIYCMAEDGMSLELIESGDEDSSANVMDDSYTQVKEMELMFFDSME